MTQHWYRPTQLTPRQFCKIDDTACPAWVENHLQAVTDPQRQDIMQRSRLSCENEIVHQVCEIARSPVLAVLEISDAFKPCKVTEDRGHSKRARPFANVFTEVVVRGVHHGEADRSTWTARLDMALAYQPPPGQPCNLIHAGQTLSYAEFKSLRP